MSATKAVRDAAAALDRGTSRHEEHGEGRPARIAERATKDVAIVEQLLAIKLMR